MPTAILFSVALLCTAPPVCTCLRSSVPPSRTMVAEEVAHSAAVFEGRVLDVELNRDSLSPRSERNPTERWLRYEELVARVVVGRRWKGVLPDTALVHTAWQGTMCSADLVKGK